MHISKLNIMAFTGAMLLLVLFASQASAQVQPSPDCEDPLAQQEMNRCAALRHARADADLNTTYQLAIIALKKQDATFKEIDPALVGAEDALRRAQRAWIDFRDAHCVVMAVSSRGGSMEPMLISGCKSQLTQARTRELQDMLDTLGG